MPNGRRVSKKALSKPGFVRLTRLAIIEDW
jgi:hypothetical protein